ncbi:MAG: TrkA C-terminal domain-containing protein, partial [Candidatus Stygibacter australis]|nr:TrkA C-terminal domain-containing protein [Candidatus Stygibacter australis]
SLLSRTIRNYVDLYSGHSLVELEAPEEWFGKTLQELALPTKRKVNVVAIKYKESIVSEQGDIHFKMRVNDLPGANDVIHEGDIIVLVGSQNKIVELMNETGK